MAGSGVPVDIPEVIWSMGTAPGAPVMVLGGRWVVDVPVVPGVGVGALGPELTELLGELDGLGLGEGLEELELGLELELGFCLSARC